MAHWGSGGGGGGLGSRAKIKKKLAFRPVFCLVVNIWPFKVQWLIYLQSGLTLKNCIFYTNIKFMCFV